MIMIKNSYEAKYKDLMLRAARDGIARKDRTGVGCTSLFNANITVNLGEGFPILTGRKMFERIFNTECDWFLSGETNIKRLVDNNVKIWNEWADDKGDLGPVYGHQLRNFNSQGVDQLENVIESLKTDPDSRRHVISLWNPAQIEDMALPPCYLYFQFFVENDKLNLFVLQRSGDIYLGVPYDIAMFSKLLMYVASEVGLKENLLSLDIIDAHLYDNHHDAAAEYLQSKTYDLPEYCYTRADADGEFGVVRLVSYESGPNIKAPVAV